MRLCLTATAAGVGVVVLALIRLWYECEYFPPYLYGEEAKLLDSAKRICTIWARDGIGLGQFVAECLEYDKGYSWFALPMYAWFGYDGRIPVLVVSTAVAISLGLMYSIYRTYRLQSHCWAGIVLAVCLAILAVCVRRYKWHTVSYFSILAVYIYFIPAWVAVRGSMRRLLRIAAIAVFAASIFFYFGAVVFSLPFMALALYEYCNRQKRVRLTWIVSAGLIAIFSFVLLYRLNPVWAFRVDISLESIRQIFDPEMLAHRVRTLGTFFSNYLTPIVTSILLVGVVSLGRGFRHGTFARVTLVLFAYSFLLQFLIEGADNPDWINWCIIPLLMTLLAGCDALYCWARSYGATAGRAVVLFLLVLAALELRRYPALSLAARHQEHAVPTSSRAQVALIIRSIVKAEDPNLVYFLPAPEIPEDQGGFLYDTSLIREDWADAWKQVRWFSDLQDLREQLRSLPAESRAVAFLGVNEARSSTFKGVLSGLRGTFQVLPLIPEIYGSHYYVARYDLERTALPLE
jgi:hypothetical protein